MSDVIKDFLISIGVAVDAGSMSKAEQAQTAFEGRVTASDRRMTKSRLREELIRNTATAETFDQRVKSAERLEQIDQKFGGLMLRRTLRQAVAQAKTSEERIQWLDKLNKAQDEHHKRTMNGMQRVAGVALTVAATIQAATVALATYATSVAAKLEQMAYSADRTGSSVASLKQFSHAVSQLGGTAGQALNDIESFAGKLRSNPQGYAGFLKSVGVEAYDAQGKLRGAAELYKEFRKNVGETKPYEQQMLYAQEMGVSEQTWRATDPAKLAAEEEAQRAKYDRLGYDPNKAAEDAKALQHALRDMFDSINIVGEKTAAKIFKDIGGNLKEFTTFIEQHGDQIAEILSKVAQVVLEVSKAILQLLTSPEVKQGFDWLLGMFGRVEEGTGKWIADNERIQSALDALAVFVATIFVAKITGAFAAILKELAPLLTRLAPLLALAGLAGLANSNGILTGPEGSRSTGEGVLRTLDPGLADRVYGKTAGDQAADAKDGRPLWKRALNAIGLGGGSDEGAGRLNAREPEGPGKYRKQYGLSEADLSQRVVNVIAGEAQTKNPESVDAVINNMLNRVGSKGWGPSGNLLEVATAPGQYAGSRPAGAKEAEFIRSRIKAIASGGIPDNTGGANAYRAAWYNGPWAQKHASDGKVVGGNRYAYEPSVPNGPYAPYANPKDVGAPAVPTQVLPRLQEAARTMADKAAAGIARLDQEKLRAVGAATEGFDPSQYFKSAPPIGTSSTNNDNSTRSQSYKGGDTTVNIHTHGDVRETAELWRRHGERQKADDLRHASNIFAA